MAWSSGERSTVVEVLETAAAKWPERWIDLVGERITHAQILEMARGFAAGLGGLGVSYGDRVATILDNSADAVGCWLGANLLGAIEVPINTAYKGEFLRHQLADSGAAVVVAEVDYAARIADVAGGLPDMRTLVVRGEGAVPSLLGVSVEPVERLRRGGALPGDLRRPAPSDLAVIIYTSGTTGPSKGCMLTHNYMVHAARRIAESLGRDETDVLYSPLPLFHLNAKIVVILGTLLTGGCAALDARFSLSGFWNEINRVGATIASLLGAMIPLIAQAEVTEEEKANTTLKVVGGAPFPPQIVEAYEKRFGVKCLCPVYGLTEAAPLTSLNAGEKAPPGSSGRADPSFEVRIFDDEDREVPVGQVGEIVARALEPHVMFEGYWSRPEETLRVMRNMWFHTGDLGRFDEQGYFYFVDRKKDYLRRRGENISSFEVELTFLRHPAIAEVAVHAVPSELTEDDLKVTAVLKPDRTLAEEELCRWCLDKVPYFAVPRYVEFRPELPRNPAGRVLKYRLREEGVTSATWDRETSDIKVERR